MTFSMQVGTVSGIILISIHFREQNGLTEIKKRSFRIETIRWIVYKKFGYINRTFETCKEFEILITEVECEIIMETWE